MREIKPFIAWDGIQTTSHKDGEYIYVKAPWHPNATKRGYVKRHRLVIEQKLGYYLPKNSIVHHVNGNKQDDRPENLEYHPDQKFHAKSHDSGKRNGNGQFVAQDPIFETIKFRLLNKHTKLFETHTLGKLIKTTFRNSQFSFAGRFTGLKDKNGKEIYEGDIVKKENPSYWVDEPDEDDLRTWSGGTGKVIYGPFTYIEDIACGEWCFNGPEGREWSPGDLEVIGNIYENPDLLR